MSEVVTSTESAPCVLMDAESPTTPTMTRRPSSESASSEPSWSPPSSAASSSSAPSSSSLSSSQWFESATGKESVVLSMISKRKSRRQLQQRRQVERRRRSEESLNEGVRLGVTGVEGDRDGEDIATEEEEEEGCWRPRSVEDIEETMNAMDKQNGTSFRSWIKNESNIGYVCMFKKSLFETYHKNDFETFILVLKWLTRDWSVSSVAEFVIKMFYNWKVDSEKFGTVVGRMVEDWDEEWKEIHENEEAIRGTRDHEEGFRPRASSFGSTETLTNATPSTISNGGGSTDQPQRTGKRKQDSLVNLLLVGEKPDAIARFMMHYTGFGKCWCHLYSEAGRRADGYVCEYHFHEGSSRSKGRKEGEPKARIWLPEDVLAFVKRLAKYSGWSETVLSSFVMEFKQLLNTTMINLPPPPRPSRQRLQNPISTSEDLELRLNNLSMVDDETSEMGNNVWYDFLADALTFYI